MKKRKLITSLNDWQEGKICLEDILNDIEAYCSTYATSCRPLCVKCDWVELPDKSSICRNCGGACSF